MVEICASFLLLIKANSAPPKYRTFRWLTKSAMCILIGEESYLFCCASIEVHLKVPIFIGIYNMRIYWHCLQSHRGPVSYMCRLSSFCALIKYLNYLYLMLKREQILPSVFFFTSHNTLQVRMWPELTTHPQKLEQHVSYDSTESDSKIHRVTIWSPTPGLIGIEVSCWVVLTPKFGSA